jgi:hypothetical protein
VDAAGATEFDPSAREEMWMDQGAAAALVSDASGFDDVRDAYGDAGGFDDGVDDYFGDDVGQHGTGTAALDRWPRADAQDAVHGSYVHRGSPVRRAAAPESLHGEGVRLMRRESTSGFPISRAEIEALAADPAVARSEDAGGGYASYHRERPPHQRSDQMRNPPRATGRDAVSLAGQASVAESDGRNDEGSQYDPLSQTGVGQLPSAAWQAELEAFEADLHRRMRRDAVAAGEGGGHGYAQRHRDRADPRGASRGSEWPSEGDAYAARGSAQQGGGLSSSSSAAAAAAASAAAGGGEEYSSPPPSGQHGVENALNKLEQLEHVFSQMLSPPASSRAH